MPVPPDDIVCRFINPDPRYQCWNDELKMPTPRAFKPAGRSVWRQKRLREPNVSFADLLIANLAGYGPAHHRAGDYLDFASAVKHAEGIPCPVRVGWRPDAVTQPWWQWRYAHVQVAATEGPADFPPEFRRRLAANARVIVPPDAHAK